MSRHELEIEIIADVLDDLMDELAFHEALPRIRIIRMRARLDRILGRRPPEIGDNE